MKRFGYSLVSLVIVLGLLITACAAPATPAPAPAKPTPTAPAPTAPGAPAVTSLEEAAKKEGQLVFWAHSLQNADTLKNAFKGKYPFIELKIWDAQSTELVAKLTEESKVGRFTVDVLTLDEGTIPSIRDLLTTYDWPSTKTWDEIYRPSHKQWVYYARSPKLPYYNTNLVSAADAPKSIEDIKDPKWRGRAINSYSNEQLPLIYAYKWGEGGKLNWDKSMAFWKEVFNNTKPRTMRGFEGAVGLLVAGEVAIHQMGSLNTYFRYLWRGAPLALAPVPEVPTTVWGVGIAKNAPHPNAARLFADFFTSTEGQVLFANGQGTLANSPEAAKIAKTNLAVVEKKINVFSTPLELYTPENNLKASNFWAELCGIKG